MKRFLTTLLLSCLVAVGVSFGQTVVEVTANITSNTSWTKNNIYVLNSGPCLYVTNNAVLTIEPGTLIKGSPSALIVTRGAKLIAEGTAEQPIVFTSAKNPGERRAGDWGGIALLGRAPLNVPGGEATLEGGCDATLARYGGTDAADNSGSLKYVRIEFAGIAFVPNQELNSLTLGGVGTGTTIENVQTSYGGDDAFEWFGGSVNGRNLIAFSTVDDMFDTDFGYSGKNQYLLGWSDPNIFDISTSNGFESDNDGTGTSNKPLTLSKFANVSLFGPRRTPEQSVNSLFGRGAHIRRSSRQSIHNAIFSGFPTGIRLESTNSQNAFLTDTLNLKGIVIANATRTLDSLATNFPNIRTKFNSLNTATIATLADLNIANPYPTSGRPSFLPNTGSVVLTGANQDIYTDTYFQKVNFRGAFGTTDWSACWAEFDPQNAVYTGAIDYTKEIPADFNAAVTTNSVAFSATLPAGATVKWEFGDFSTSTELTPTKIYPALGTYTVKLTITSARGCTKTISKQVTIATGASEVAITSDITTNTTWTSDKIYRLTGSTCLYVRNNATLTIQPGTVIKGDPSALIITRGSKLIAEGTADKPIVFTSGKAAGQRRAGDWGGIALLGRAPLNVPGNEATLEGGCDANQVKYGGTDAADNSGSLKYVRIEFAGVAFVPNQELNSLTLAGVGTGTTIENVQTSYGGDDAFEWFGGSVNGRNLIAFSTVDDMFDTDFGYSGKNQYLLGWSDPNIFDISTSNGFESDNDGTGTSNKPLTSAKFANVSLFGPRRTPEQSVNSLFGRGAHIRRSSRQSIHNAIFSGFPTGFRLESTNTQNAFLSDTLQLKGVVIANATRTLDSLATNFPNIRTKFNSLNTATIATLADLNIANPYPTSGRPSFLPNTGSVVLTGANQDIYTDTYFQKVNFRGAFGTTDWSACWSEFDPQNADYSRGVDYFATFPADITTTITTNRVAFTVTLPAGAKVEWDFGDFTKSTEAAPTKTYAALGTYTVKLTITSDRGCTKTISKQVTIASGTSEVAITGDITTNTTWTNDKIYRLTGSTCLYVRNNATLTIQAGTIVKGDPSALIITRGSKLIAEGTAEQPIIFTSGKAAGQRRAGDWGGIALLGRAPLNVPGNEATLEGGCDANQVKYGGTDAADNSGSLKYVRIEFAGVAFVPNQELNSLTLGGVGTGTTLENIQTSYGGDDAFEWFGGTVNGRNLIAFSTVDDMFDTDFGYSGKNQYLLGWSDPNIFDISTSNGFESDNDGTGTSNKPLTSAKFANVSLFGPRRTPAQSVNSLFGRGAHIRRSSRQSIHNAIFSGFPTGFRLESTNTQNAFLTDTLQLKGVVVANATRTLDSLATNFPNLRTKFNSLNTATIATLADLNITDPYPTSGRPNFLPKSGSIVLTGANQDIYTDTYFQKVNFRGAFGSSDWTGCWAEFDPQNADYSVSPVNYFTGKPTTFAFVSPSNKATFTGPAGAGLKYSWDFGVTTSTADTSSTANPTFVYPTIGSYTATLVVSNARGCSTTLTRAISVTTSLEEIKELNAFRLFPNPTAGNTTLELNLTARIDAVVSVRNVAGQVMLSQKQTLLQGMNRLELPTANLANGIYTVEVKSTSGLNTLKLMVTKN